MVSFIINIVKERVKVELFASTANNATALKNAINTYVATLEESKIYNVDTDASVMAYDSKYHVLFTLRLNDKEAYDTIKDVFLAFGVAHATLSPLILKDSKITHHICPHDDSDMEQKCSTANEWTKSANGIWIKNI